MCSSRLQWTDDDEPMSEVIEGSKILVKEHFNELITVKLQVFTGSISNLLSSTSIHCYMFHVNKPELPNTFKFKNTVLMFVGLRKKKYTLRVILQNLCSYKLNGS